MAWEDFLASTPSGLPDCITIPAWGMTATLAALFASGCFSFQQGLLLSQALGDACDTDLRTTATNSYHLLVAGIEEQTLAEYSKQACRGCAPSEYCFLMSSVNDCHSLLLCTEEAVISH